MRRSGRVSKVKIRQNVNMKPSWERWRAQAHCTQKTSVEINLLFRSPALIAYLPWVLFSKIVFYP